MNTVFRSIFLSVFVLLSSTIVNAQAVSADQAEYVVRFSQKSQAEDVMILVSQYGGVVTELGHNFVIGGITHVGGMSISESMTRSGVNLDELLITYHTDFARNVLLPQSQTISRTHVSTGVLNYTAEVEEYVDSLTQDIGIDWARVLLTLDKREAMLQNRQVDMVVGEDGVIHQPYWKNFLFLPVLSGSSEANLGSSFQISAASQVESWIPEEGYVLVQPHQSFAGKRYVHNQFWWDDVSGFDIFSTYEHDFFLNADPNSKYGGGTYLYPHANVRGFPVVDYWASDLPFAYLDTRFGDPWYQPAYTIGSGFAKGISTYRWYYTYILTSNGTANVDTAALQGQRGHQSPQWCRTVWCSYGDEHRYIIGNGWSFDVPNYVWWRY